MRGLEKDLVLSGYKVDRLVKIMTRLVGKGHDNELFVIMADLLELHEHLGPLLTAIRPKSKDTEPSEPVEIPEGL